MIGALINLIIYLIILGLLFWVINYAIDSLPVAEPFARIAKVLLLVVAVLIIIVLLLQLIGQPLGSLQLPHVGG